jgi:hypothetical protein
MIATAYAQVTAEAVTEIVAFFFAASGDNVILRAWFEAI